MVLPRSLAGIKRKSNHVDRNSTAGRCRFADQALHPLSAADNDAGAAVQLTLNNPAVIDIIHSMLKMLLNSGVPRSYRGIRRQC